MKRCPICGRKPKLEKWYPIDIDPSVVLYAYSCKQRDHICHGSYRNKKRDAKIDWDLVVFRKECKIKNERG
jgi:hypothetical protein